MSNSKHPNLIRLEIDSDFTTRGKVIEVVYLDGKRETLEPTPLEESERSRKLRAEIFNEFRQYGRMPILWRDILKEIVASGDKAVELANTLNEVIKSMEAFYAFMAKHQMNRPNPYGLSQTTHGMIEGNGDGKYQINPNAFSIYSRG